MERTIVHLWPGETSMAMCTSYVQHIYSWEYCYLHVNSYNCQLTI